MRNANDLVVLGKIPYKIQLALQRAESLNERFSSYQIVTFIAIDLLKIRSRTYTTMI